MTKKREIKKTGTMTVVEKNVYNLAETLKKGGLDPPLGRWGKVTQVNLPREQGGGSTSDEKRGGRIALKETAAKGGSPNLGGGGVSEGNISLPGKRAKRQDKKERVKEKPLKSQYWEDVHL